MKNREQQLFRCPNGCPLDGQPIESRVILDAAGRLARLRGTRWTSPSVAALASPRGQLLAASVNWIRAQFDRYRVFRCTGPS